MSLKKRGKIFLGKLMSIKVLIFVIFLVLEIVLIVIKAYNYDFPFEIISGLYVLLAAAGLVITGRVTEKISYGKSFYFDKPEIDTNIED